MKSSGNCRDLTGYERIGVRFINADRAAEHDDEIGQEQGVGSENDRRPPRDNGSRSRDSREARKQAEILESDVANGKADLGHLIDF